MEDTTYGSASPTSSTRPKTLEFKNIHPLQAGKVLGLLYAFLSLIFIPFLLIGPVLGGADGLVAVLPMLFMMILYPVMGFIGGVIMAALYNFIASLIGGIRVDVS